MDVPLRRRGAVGSQTCRILMGKIAPACCNRLLGLHRMLQALHVRPNLVAEIQAVSSSTNRQTGENLNSLKHWVMYISVYVL